MRDSARKPLRTRLKSSASGARFRGTSMMRRFFLRRSTASASGWKLGATTASTNNSASAVAVSASSTVLKPTTDPNADTGSVARALRYASSGVLPSAMPHGVVCLMMTHAVSSGHGSRAK